MQAEPIEVTTEDGVADSYLACPDAAERAPGVLLLTDIFGLRPQIARMMERIASWGYTVLAPNLFYRAGRAPLVPLEGLSDPGRREALLEQLRPQMAQLSDELIERDGRAYLDFLERITGSPLGITGYCMGGRVGWRIAASNPRDRVGALGCFHTGGLVSDSPDSPHRSAAAPGAELYFGHADNDRSMTAEQIAVLEDALDRAGVTYRSEVYSGAAHGYTMADTPVFDEGAAERHYRELRALLERRLGAPTG